ncbi:MAG: hypothetical protein AUJ92_07690 [Armatimonadetes bacterium CG2_30_59_28]|nr:hypothetical protein [Armatimonadota bacterium]OIO95565.1 MAG: hypothetical protein AUJ92_07690 [Armatimonadetes bacterium CG2_30_59_28]PIU62745.1 MAG: hypothetical protein COS85_17595 [Armatimonadetes bacterium CG07_land_8_20_14_0_80_59_28]PIY37233.1 MAG: hypothetical protein COZ05_22790 [Armatimonadetes bacterium CG_4_10_14_3_um_filter_59_10]PJB67456.1 MAG: hypothetical protein CO095_12155 [Armatimonadetes bacterium CG_4_9_14_3_um_filter_58_7]
MKPLVYGVGLLAICLSLGLWAGNAASTEGDRRRRFGWAVSAAALVLVGLASSRSDLRDYALPSRAFLDGSHFLIAGIVFIAAVAALIATLRAEPSISRPRGVAAYLAVALAFTALCGLLMLVNISGMATLARLTYTGFELGLLGLLAGVVWRLVNVLAQGHTGKRGADL